MQSLLHDIQYALRQLRRSPGFTITAVLTLALGIGATTAIFSVMNAVMLRSLPVPNPQELMYVHVPGGEPDGASNTGNGETALSEPVFEALRQDHRVFQEVMAFVPLSHEKVAVRIGNSPEQAQGDMVSGNLFSGLGVGLSRGRPITVDDEQRHAQVVVLSNSYWTRRFLRDPAAIGSAIYVKGVPFTVVGVAAKGFAGVEAEQSTDFWIPLQSRPELNAWGVPPENNTVYGSPKWWFLMAIARLKPGVTAEQAVAAAIPGFQQAAYAPLGRPDPKMAMPKVKMALQPAKGIEGLNTSYQKPISILMTLVGLVLVIACSNVAMLIVARNASRQRDFSLRMALGAGRALLLRQLLIESGLLVALGAGLGWSFALLATRALAAWSQLEVSLAPDTTVLLLTLAISIAAALLFGLAPLRMATNLPATLALRTSIVSQQARRGQAGNIVIALQIAFCFALLTAAGLLLRTLLNYENTDLGIRTQGLLVFGISPQNAVTVDEKLAYYRVLLPRLRALPAVEGVTTLDHRFGSGWSDNNSAMVDGANHPDITLRTNVVGPDFLHVMGIPLLEGRDLEDADTKTSPHVAVVNETFVEKLLPHTNPIGHTVGSANNPFTIVGVARNNKYTSVDERAVPMAYALYAQVGYVPGTMQIEMRVDGDPSAMLPTVARAIHEVDPNVPLEKPMTQAAVFQASYSDQRMFSRLAMFFGLLAALLVGIGLYGTLSYRVGRRTGEIGVRIALGARRGQILSMILRESMRLAAVGLVVGAPLSWMVGRYMGSMLFGLQPHDAVTLMAAFALVIAVGLTASFIPARRAASIEPMQALRAE